MRRDWGMRRLRRRKCRRWRWRGRVCRIRSLTYRHKLIKPLRRLSNRERKRKKCKGNCRTWSRIQGSLKAETV